MEEVMMNEQSGEQMLTHEEEQNSIVKAAKKHFNKFGLSFFAGSIIIFAVQFLVGLVVSAFWPHLLEDMNSSLILSMVPMYVVGMPLMILLIRLVPAKQLPKHKMSFGKCVLAAIMCYSIMYISNIVGSIITFVISLAKGGAVDNVLQDVTMGTGVGIRALFMVVCAPIFEELIFRKLLVDRVVRYGEGVAVILSGLMFGLFHGNLSQFAYAFTIGMFLAFIYVKTGEIKYTIGLHMVMNFVGGVLSVWILEISGYTELMANPELMSNPAALEENMAGLMIGLLIMLAYVFCLFGIVIAGFVLLIVFRKKFKVNPGEIVLPRGKRFVTIICNVGMILFCIYWIATIVMQLLQ